VASGTYAPRTEYLNDFVRRTFPSSNSPLIVSMPHGGSIFDKDLVPNNLDLDRPDVQKTVYVGIDHSVPLVTRVRERDDIYIIETDLARTVLDPNRGANDVDRHSVENRGHEPKSQGLLWNATIAARPEDIRSMLTHPYKHEEFENLKKNGLYPFEIGIREAMAEAKDRYGHAVLFDAHSIWNNATSTVQNGDPQSEHHLGAYLVGESLDEKLLEDFKMPHLYLMTSGKVSCSPELVEYIINHFKEYGLNVEQREVASSRFKLAHKKYADRERGYEVFSMEIIGHFGLEKDRAEGIVLFDPEPAYLTLLQKAFEDFISGLRDLRWIKG